VARIFENPSLSPRSGAVRRVDSCVRGKGRGGSISIQLGKTATTSRIARVPRVPFRVSAATCDCATREHNPAWKPQSLSLAATFPSILATEL
jgi:hypothetical protein